MSYHATLDRLVGKQVAEYEAAKELERLMECFKHRARLPYGYPVRVYCPRHPCRAAQFKKLAVNAGGVLDNGVPRALAMRLVGSYVLGAYNPGCCFPRAGCGRRKPWRRPRPVLRCLFPILRWS
jgi:hypothetical protein